jgi:hypothetical protein
MTDARPSGHFPLVLRATAGVVRRSAFVVPRTGSVFVAVSRVTVARTRRAPILCIARVTLTDSRVFPEVSSAGHLTVVRPSGGAAHGRIARIVSPGDGCHHRSDKCRADKEVHLHLPCSLPKP